MAASDFSARRWWPVGIAVVLAATACQAFVTFAVDGPDASVTTDGGEAGPPVVDVIDPCGPELPTRRDGGPRPDDTPSLFPPLLFAAYVWGFEARGRPELCPEPGINLDGVDTQGAACDNTACISRPAGRNCDLAGGIDNATKPALEKLRTYAGVGNALDSLDLDVMLNRGATNILVELAAYNGLPDDDQVRVSIFASSGVVGQEIAASHGELKLRAEIWDGGQSFGWVLDDKSVGDTRSTIIPKYSADAFVRAGVLVVPQMPLGFAPPGLLAGGQFSMHNVRLTARVVRDDARFKLTHVRLIGTFESAALLSAIGRIRVKDEKQLCDPTSKDYPLIRAAACSSLDMPAASEGTYAPGALCNEASFAFGMAMVQQDYGRVDAGEGRTEYAVGPGFGSYAIAVCPDLDAGTEWCDDCSWSDGARRCDASTRVNPLPPFDAGTD